VRTLRKITGENFGEDYKKWLGIWIKDKKEAKIIKK